MFEDRGHRNKICRVHSINHSDQSNNLCFPAYQKDSFQPAAGHAENVFKRMAVMIINIIITTTTTTTTTTMIIIITMMITMIIYDMAC